MAKLNLEKYRQPLPPFTGMGQTLLPERPPAFSPAAEAQENYGRNSMLWKFISQWIPWQYTNFIDESLSFHKPHIWAIGVRSPSSIAYQGTRRP